MNSVIYSIYWAALKWVGSEVMRDSLQDWSERLKHMYDNRLDYPFKDAVEIIEKYGATNDSSKK